MHLPHHRLHRQLVTRPRQGLPAEVAGWFGALQSQDYLGALWALGLRTRGATEATIESAIADGSVIRTHLFRGTWQYVAREDVRWMLALVGRRVIAASASRYRQLELDPRTLGRCCELFGRALAGGGFLTRKEMGEVLTRGGIPAVAPRLMHILGHAELEGVICSGPRRGKQPTHALLDARVPASPPLTRDEGLCLLAVRYFQSRGPATDRDFAWWTGLPLGEARAAIALAEPELRSESIGGVRHWDGGRRAAVRSTPDAHLLPPFDEYLIAYQDRSAMLDPRHARRVNNGGGMLSPALVLGGQVAGTWKRTLAKDHVAIRVAPLRKLTGDERECVLQAGERYGRFLGLEPRVRIAGRA